MWRMEFAKALKINAGSRDGYMESDEAVITWCVGHLVTMSYPEEYRSGAEAVESEDSAVYSPENLNMK